MPRRWECPLSRAQVPNSTWTCRCGFRWKPGQQSEAEAKRPRRRPEKPKIDKDLLNALEDAPSLSTEEARQDDRNEEPPEDSAQRKIHRQELMRRATLVTNLLQASNKAGKVGADEWSELSVIAAGL